MYKYLIELTKQPLATFHRHIRIPTPSTHMKTLYTLLLACSTFTSVLAQDGEFHLDKVYTVSKKGTIDLSSSDAKVFITGSLRPDAYVKIDRKVIMKGFYSSREDFKVEVEAEGGDLKIREYQNSVQNGIISYQSEDYKIVIEAPEGMSLRIRGDDGDYYIKNINGDIIMSIDDADAELSDCKGKKFAFRIDDGDIRMNKGSGSLEIDADDADVEIYNGSFTSIQADADDGDVIIETSLTDDGQYDFNSQDGLVSLNITSGGGEFDIRNDDGHIMTQGVFKTTYESDDHTKLTLPSGSARVVVRADDAKVKLTARN